MKFLTIKDKLKVVVTSRIVTPASSSRAVEIEENSITPGVSETDSSCVLNRGVNRLITKEGENNFSSLPSTSSIDESFTCENDSDDDPLPPPIRKRPHRQALGTDDNFDEFTTSNMEKSDENQDVCIKKKKIEKLEEDAVPLPDPFPLPKHYSAEVEAALRATKMTNVTRRAFIGKIAAAMLYYKRYPTHDDYINVGRAIIESYPFMKSPVGSPAVSFTKL